MKMTNMRNWLSGLLFLGVLSMTACKKETSTTPQNTDQEEIEATLNSSEADAEAEAVYDNVFDDVMGVDDEVGMSGTGIFGREGGSSNGVGAGDRQPDSLRCFTVTRTPLNPPARFPLKVVIDFGNGCTGPGGHTRKGKIIIVYTGRLVVPGSMATTTFDGFYIDNVKVEGTHIVKNESTPLEFKFVVKVIDGKLLKANGDYSKWNNEKVTKQISGLGTPFYPLDDVFSITGAGYGQVKKGIREFNWRAGTTQPLIKRFTCRWLVDGKVKIVKLTAGNPSPWVAEINYGFPNANCDNKATLTINGVTTIITLH
jgi:hypothetical protein